jgi:choline-sulfatase
MASPNVLFLMSDEHNPRFRGGLDDGEPVETPALDALAEQSVSFDSAYCPVPICGPSRKSILTGKEQRNADAWDNDAAYEDDVDTLPASFGAAGYETCLVGKMHFNGTNQFNGFDHRPYGDLTGHGVQQPSHQPDPVDPDKLTVQPRRQGIETGTRIPGAGETEIPESLLQEQVVARESIAWLREQRASDDRPWFLTASFSRPHFPLTAPQRWIDRYWPDGFPEPPIDRAEGHEHPFVEAQADHHELDTHSEEELQMARAAYFACVSYLDEVIGEFLSTLESEGFLEDTIVVYTSDHGDMAGEHGLWWKQAYHEGSSRVPLFVQTPEHRRGEREPSRISTPVSLIDLYPTLAGLAGSDAPDDLDGVDLSRAIENGEEPDRGPVFVDHLSYGGGFSYRMIRDGRYKYVGFRDAPELLFDLEADPHETENLAEGASGADAEALERLRDLYEETVDWGAIDRERSEFKDHVETSLPIPPGTGNAYLLPDGRLVDAATPVYKPDELADDPERVIDDFPTDD